MIVSFLLVVLWILGQKKCAEITEVCLFSNQVLEDTERKTSPLPDEFFHWEPKHNDKLSTQIAEPEGLHTCDMIQHCKCVHMARMA